MDYGKILVEIAELPANEYISLTTILKEFPLQADFKKWLESSMLKKPAKVVCRYNNVDTMPSLMRDKLCTACPQKIQCNPQWLRANSTQG